MLKFPAMKIIQSFEEFCNLWYKKAMSVADITIAKVEKKNGPFGKSLDIDSVKALGVTYALEKTFNTYDIDNDRHASIETYLSTLVRNCVLTELGKETTAVKRAHAFVKPKEDKYKVKYSTLMGGIPQRGNIGRIAEPHDYVQAYGWVERKEEALEKLVDLLKKLPPIDQVVLSNWMNDERSYLEKSIDALGLEDSKRTRDMLSLRRNRALKALRDMMGGKRPNYRDIYIPAGNMKDADGMEAQYLEMERSDRNFERRRERAAKAYITRSINYKSFSESAYNKLIKE